MAEVRVEDGENIDAALRRFKKEVMKAGIISEVKRRERHENLQNKKKRKKLESRQRVNFKRRSNKSF